METETVFDIAIETTREYMRDWLAKETKNGPGPVEMRPFPPICLGETDEEDRRLGLVGEKWLSLMDGPFIAPYDRGGFSMEALISIHNNNDDSMVAQRDGPGVDFEIRTLNKDRIQVIAHAVLQYKPHVLTLYKKILRNFEIVRQEISAPMDRKIGPTKTRYDAKRRAALAIYIKETGRATTLTNAAKKAHTSTQNIIKYQTDETCIYWLGRFRQNWNEADRYLQELNRPKVK
jgi:hypothetical protein